MKLKVGVFFGGESVEHEISIISANQAMPSIKQNMMSYQFIYLKNANGTQVKHYLM